LAARPGNVNPGGPAHLSFAAARGKARGMDKTPDSPSREERLAAKLRENLKRRKAQARQLDHGASDPLPKAPPKS
jgi:hypothetical protein